MPPTKLAHVVFQTNHRKAMQDWYCEVLGGHVIYENARLSFVTYDDEHHRVAFLDYGPLTPRPRAEGGGMAVAATDHPGVHHVAFTFGSMGELLDNYLRLKGRGILPFRSINHGPTTSMYYADPDGNRIELQIDNFATAAEGQAWMHSPRLRPEPDRGRVRSRRAGPEVPGGRAGGGAGDPRLGVRSYIPTFLPAPR